VAGGLAMEVRESWQGCRHCRPPRRLCRHHHSNVGWFHQHFNVTYTQSLDLVPPSSPSGGPPPPPRRPPRRRRRRCPSPAAWPPRCAAQQRATCTWTRDEAARAPAAAAAAASSTAGCVLVDARRGQQQQQQRLADSQGALIHLHSSCHARGRAGWNRLTPMQPWGE
jgi:hypothetical protein